MTAEHLCYILAPACEAGLSVGWTVSPRGRNQVPLVLLLDVKCLNAELLADVHAAAPASPLSLSLLFRERSGYGVIQDSL